jgi:phage tail-like protein
MQNPATAAATADADALAGYTFQIEIDSLSIAQFKEVSGLSTETAVIEQQQATKLGQQVLKKLPGPHKWGDITLKRGVTTDKSLWEWRKKVEAGMIDQARKNGSIVLYDYKHGEVHRFNFQNGWPSKIELGSLQAGSTEMLAETVTITHEGLKLG